LDLPTSLAFSALAVVHMAVSEVVRQPELLDVIFECAGAGRVEAWLRLGRVCKTWQAAVASRKEANLGAVAAARLAYHSRQMKAANSIFKAARAQAVGLEQQRNHWTRILRMWESADAEGQEGFDDWRELFDDGESWEEAGDILRGKVDEARKAARAASLRRQEAEIAVESLPLPPVWAVSAARNQA